MGATVAVYDQKTIDALKQELIDRTMELHHRIESLEYSRVQFSDAHRKHGWRIEKLEERLPHPDERPFRDRSSLPKSWSENSRQILDSVREFKTQQQNEIEQLKAENEALRVENHRLRDEVEGLGGALDILRTEAKCLIEEREEDAATIRNLQEELASTKRAHKVDKISRANAVENFEQMLHFVNIAREGLWSIFEKCKETPNCSIQCKRCADAREVAEETRKKINHDTPPPS